MIKGEMILEQISDFLAEIKNQLKRLSKLKDNSFKIYKSSLKFSF